MQFQSLGWEDPWRRKWQSTPVFLPGKLHGQRSLYSPWGQKSQTRLSTAPPSQLKPGAAKYFLFFFFSFLWQDMTAGQEEAGNGAGENHSGTECESGSSHSAGLCRQIQAEAQGKETQIGNQS